jgi:hypothetical protein
VYFYVPPEPTQAAFTNLTADGSTTFPTSKLTLTFDQDITGLAAADITLNAGITGAAKGALTRTATGTYELTVTGITQSGTVTVSATKTGYAISGGPKTVTVYYYIGNGSLSLDISFAQINDAAPSISGPTLYLVSNFGPTNAPITVSSPEQYDSITWRVQNTTVTGSGSIFILSADNPAYNQIAEHFVTVMVIKNGVPYNKTVTFKVEY